MKKDEILSRSKKVSILLFVVAVALWAATLFELAQNPEYQRMVLEGEQNPISHTWYVICTLWNVSLYFKCWVIVAVASTVVSCPTGVFLGLCATLASLILPLFSSAIAFGTVRFILVSVDAWILIVSLNTIVLILWLVKAAIKESKKEVSLEM